MLIESVPKPKVTALTGAVTAFFALAMMLGPILGGAINNSNSAWAWRWVFLVK
jgi:MFS family permease